jgi:2-amino-4-hydroxy-6-hydroxymethyldihydropteridine diphosphokinase
VENVVLILGTNLGDRKSNLESAREFIQEHLGEITGSSSIYFSSSWGYDGKEFLNQVISIQSSLNASDLLTAIKKFERNSGRKERAKSYADRTIDIDILYYGDEIIEEEGLTVPHEAMQKRRFVLMPLADLLPVYVHPLLKKTSAELLELCPDQGTCEVWNDV